MTRSRLTAAGAALVLIGALLLPGVAASAQGEVTEVGWWTRLPTASAPEGGINVGSAPDGPNSIGAVRVDLGAGLSSLTVTAVEAGGVPESATVRLCPAADAWTAAEGGALGDAPERDCSTSVLFERGDDGTWTADATPLVVGRTGSATIAFVADGPSGGNPIGVAGSEVSFERPAASGQPVPTTAAPTTRATTTTTRSVTPTTASSFQTVPPTRPAVTSPPTTDPSTDTTVLAIPEVTTTTSIPIAEERALPAVTDAGVASGDDRPIAEAFFLVFLATLVGIGVGGASKLAELRS